MAEVASPIMKYDKVRTHTQITHQLRFCSASFHCVLEVATRQTMLQEGHATLTKTMNVLLKEYHSVSNAL